MIEKIKTWLKDAFAMVIFFAIILIFIIIIVLKVGAELGFRWVL